MVKSNLTWLEHLAKAL